VGELSRRNYGIRFYRSPSHDNSPLPDPPSKVGPRAWTQDLRTTRQNGRWFGQDNAISQTRWHLPSPTDNSYVGLDTSPTTFAPIGVTL